MEDLDDEISSVEQEISATKSAIIAVENKIGSWDLKIEECEKELNCIVSKINDVDIALSAVTTVKDEERLNEEIHRLENSKLQLNTRMGQMFSRINELSTEAVQLRNEFLIYLAKSERLSIAKMSAQIVLPNEIWNLDNLETMLQRERQPFPLPTGTPAEFIGRSTAIDAIQSVVMGNFRDRTSIDNTAFTFLLASGHIMSGKTRAGMETPRLVEELCSKLSARPDNNGARLVFTKPVYLLIDFLKTSKVDPIFDAKHQDPSVTLGARLMCAFYKHDTLKAIKHDQALNHIIETILSGTGANDSVIVPIVIHFDEHSQFVEELNQLKTGN